MVMGRDRAVGGYAGDFRSVGAMTLDVSGEEVVGWRLTALISAFNLLIGCWRTLRPSNKHRVLSYKHAALL